MIQCQACGQSNNDLSNFCRFCGTNFTQAQKQEDYDFAPPKPYAWKTDEFEISKAKQRKTQEFQFGGQRQETAPVNQHPFQTQQMVYQKPYGVMQQNLGGCPRCGSPTSPRIERKISTAGWVVFAVLLVTFFPLFWLGFFIKEDVAVCPMCGYRFV